jgi:hypothetical protein
VQYVPNPKPLCGVPVSILGLEYRMGMSALLLNLAGEKNKWKEIIPFNHA